ncbi:MAG: DNA ligase [Erysipelotrichaceae bacterium]|nr:DNA ligase [Erysipelotrichaceae bacterium]
MSKMNELSQILEEMITAGEKLIETANALKDYFSETEQEAETVKKEAAPQKEAQPKEEKTPEAPTPTKTDVRAVLAAKSAAGHKTEVQALLKKYGAAKLAEVNPADYAAIIKEAEVIGNA